MTIGEIIALLLTALIVGMAVAYIVRSKKSGKKCIGCPYASSCSGGCSCNTKELSDCDNCTEKTDRETK